MNAIGLIEIQGLTAAIEAVDTMLKTANVEFQTWEKKLGGRLVTVIIKGDVAAVQEAIANAVAKAIGHVAAHAVIPNPHEETMKMVHLSAQKQNKGSGE